MDRTDELLFADDDEKKMESGPFHVPSWKVLIVDDEEEVHRMTRLVLDDFRFDGRGLTFISAYSGDEGVRCMAEHPDTAVILLDVVMETTEAGLDMVRSVRRDLGNKLCRIILRTGQPGQAPEHTVITDYDINDYKEKSELTSQKLFSSMVTALRGYRDITTLDRQRKGLQQIIEATSDLFGVRSVRQLATGVLNQLTGTLGMSGDSLFLQAIDSQDIRNRSFRIVAATGKFENCVSLDDEEPTVCLDSSVNDLVIEAIEQGASIVRNHVYVGVFPHEDEGRNVIYLEGRDCCRDRLEESLIHLFSNNVSVAVDNVRLNDELMRTKQDVVLCLGEALERRESRAGQHVRRVVEMSGLLCSLAGFSDIEAERIKLSSPMHDVGKAGVPDSLLLKPGPLTPEEFEVVKMHTVIGYDILGGNSEDLLGDAAIVAMQHHENWDGSGYPHGLRGEEISPLARTVSLCDVYDTLLHDRVYASAWSMEEVTKYIADNRGVMFEPRLVDIFFEHLKDFEKIQADFPDR